MYTSFFIVMVVLSIIAHLDGKALQDVGVITDGNAGTVIKPSGQKGMTFVKGAHLAQFGIDLVGCRNWSDPNGMNCDAYQGDTDCNQLRPVLCAKEDNTPRPPYSIPGGGGVMPPEFYYGWNRGHIATSVLKKGSEFANKAAVDTFCESSFGTGWRVAEFHDGYYILNMNGNTYAGDSWTQNANQQQQGGWYFYSYGDIRNDIRFWVHITDQPSTCWAK